MNPIYLIPGLGADQRLFKYLINILPNTIPIQWIPPIKEESMQDYSKRLSKQYIKSDSPVIIGVSLGGMMAVEISKSIPSSKIIIISSIKHKKEKPFYLRFLKAIPLHKLIPQSLLMPIGRKLSFVFGKLSTHDGGIFHEMLKDSNPDFMIWAINQIINWNNTYIPDHIVHIHGTRDMILPARYIKNAILVKGGSHMMIWSMHDEVNHIIKNHLS